MLPDSFQAGQLWWALLALPIVALYYWTFRRRSEQVATLALWKRALARRSAWSRWRRLVSLGVQLSLQAFLVLSLTRLDWSPAARGIRSLVLVVDTSASMKATDVPPSRFAQSLAEAKRMIEGLERDERAAIVTSGSRAGIACPPTGDKRRLLRALDGLSADDEPGQMELAIDVAQRIAAGQPNSSIVVFTDAQFSGAARLAATKNVRLIIAAAATDNVAITRLAARASLVTYDHAVLVEATNFSPEPKTVSVELSLSDARLDTLRLELPAGGSSKKVIAAKLSEGGLLAARLTPGDDFPTDDTALALVPPDEGIGDANNRGYVTFVGDAKSPTAAALRAALPRERLVIQPELTDSRALTKVLILEGRVPGEIPGIRTLVLAPTNSCDLWDVLEPSDGRFEVKSLSHEGPLAGIDLSGVVIEQLVRLKFKAPAKTLIATSGGEPLLSWTSSPSGIGKVLVWHAPLDKCDLAQRPEFPRMMAQAINWLDGPSGGSESLAFATGERASFARTPTEPTSSMLLTQTGAIPLSAGKDDPSTGSIVPVNLFHDRESDLRTTEDLPAGAPVASPVRRWFDEPFWSAFLVAAVCLLVVDWYFFHRRTLV